MAFQAKPRIISRAVGKLREVVTQPIYDSRNIPTGAGGWNAAITFFANANSAGQHPMISNMVLVGVLENPKAASINGISFYIPPTCSGVDMKTILANSALVFNVAAKEYWKGPAWMCAGGGGMFGTGTDVNTNGWPSLNNYYHFRQPVPLEAMVSFEVVLLAPPAAQTIVAAAGVTVTTVLWAVQGRKVQ